MQKIEPVGAFLIVKPLKMDETKTEGGIIAMDLELEKGQVLEVSNEWSDRYSIGDIILYPKDSGLTLPHYKKQNCLWINGKASTDGGDVYAKIIE